MSPQKSAVRTKGLGRQKVRVLSDERPSEDLVLLRVERPGGADYGFEAGQFLYVYHPSGAKKPYSIASSPDDERGLDLAVKKIEGGALSSYLYGLKEGQEVEITRAVGAFKLKTPPGMAYVGLATGTGVAPLRSMIHYMLAHEQREIWLFLGSATRNNLPYHAEWERLDREHERFRYVPSCTREGMDWTGERGWIQEPFTKHFQGRSGYEVYLCGIRRMVDDVTRQLQEEMGIDTSTIHKEKYV